MKACFLTLMTASIFVWSGAVSATDSDSDGVSDAMEAGHGSDPFSNYAVGSGSKHSCAIDEDGVVCWGHNNFDQIDVPTLSNPVRLGVGGHHNCVLHDYGISASPGVTDSGACWGWPSAISVPGTLDDNDESNPILLATG